MVSEALSEVNVLTCIHCDKVYSLAYIEISGIMSYQADLFPWVIYCRLADMRRLEVQRFRRRNDAEEYLKLVQRLTPEGEFELVFAGRHDRPPSDKASIRETIAQQPPDDEHADDEHE